MIVPAALWLVFENVKLRRTLFLISRRKLSRFKLLLRFVLTQTLRVETLDICTDQDGQRSTSRDHGLKRRCGHLIFLPLVLLLTNYRTTRQHGNIL